MNGAQGSNMLIAAVMGCHRMVIFPSRCRSFAISGWRRIHPRQEVQQFAPHLWVRFGKKLKSPRVANTQPTRFAPGDVVGKSLYLKPLESSYRSCPPDMPRKLTGLNATTQQSQPRCGIELTVEKIAADG